MRKIVSHMILTLDGVAIFDAAVDTIVRLRDKEVLEDFSAQMAEEDAMLLGRVTYGEWAGFWPTSTMEPFATHINSVPKYVASKTLTSVSWGTHDNASLLHGALSDAVAALRLAPGKNIGVHGSPSLVESLLHANLLDELRLEIYPVLAGTGARLFHERPEVKQMELIRSRVTANGVVILTYRPTDASPE
jgi:dihydrofolate reductase